ncbi:MAG: metallophosphoesterase [bacterium]
MNRKFWAALLVLIVTLVTTVCGSSSADWSELPAYLNGGIVVYGDSRTGHSAHAWIMEGIATIKPSAVFHTGDLVGNGNDPDDWKTFNRIASKLPPGTPIYPALGNHEKESPLYFNNFTLPGNERWYSVEISGIHLAILDTGTDLSPGSTQYQWLENDLSTIGPGINFIAVVFHYPPYSTGKHGEDEKGLRSKIVPLFEQYGVDLVFNGHDHNYERLLINGVQYIVTGGGGAPLRSQARTSPGSLIYKKVHHFVVIYFTGNSNLSVDVWDWTVNLIDQFEVAP